MCVQLAWLCTMYILEQPVIQVLHRMPIQTYNSYLIGLAVSALCTSHQATDPTFYKPLITQHSCALGICLFCMCTLQFLPGR